MANSELKNEFRDNFKKSDALNELKELSKTMSKEEFVKFSNSALLDAYRSDRVKAVEFMLSFYEKEQPKLLIQIHLDLMLSDEKKFESGKQMLIPLVNHFTEEFCSNLVNHIVDHKEKQYPRMDIEPYKLRKTEILKIVNEKQLPPPPPIVKKPTLIEVMNQNPTALKNDARDKLKKSDIIIELKELSKIMPKEDFMEFTSSAMKSAYDHNRVKAVEFMLSFYEKDQPPLLARIHLQRMLADQRDFDSGKKMLVPLAKHYSYEFCDEVMNQYIEGYALQKSASEARQKEISKILLENTLSKESKKAPKKLKI
jgi:hypothetical protein